MMRQEKSMVSSNTEVENANLQSYVRSRVDSKQEYEQLVEEIGMKRHKYKKIYE